RKNGDVEAFFLVVAFAERHVPRRVPPQADEIERELQLAFLRLQHTRSEAGNSDGNQTSKHGLPSRASAPGALRSTQWLAERLLLRVHLTLEKYHKIFDRTLKDRARARIARRGRAGECHSG